MEGVTRAKRLELQNFFKRHYPDAELPTIWRLREKLQSLTNIEPVWYHCCPKICIAYTGTYAELSACPKCHISRCFPGTTKPRKKWPFYPIGPRLIRQYAGEDAERLMRYRAGFDHEDESGDIKDVFSAKWYQELRDKGFFSR
jgi:hypothetical protein